MNILLAAINAKYIHPNMAIRLLKANTSFPVDLKEWTIKDDVNKIAMAIMQYELIGISCYIWNIEMVKQILLILQEKHFKGIIVLGGPEVYYENEVYFADYGVDYIIINEGEEAFHQLIYALKNNTSTDDIPNLQTKAKRNRLAPIKNLDDLASPFFALDYPNQIMYIESSRGCPYKCSYCMASLEDRVRNFNIETVKKTLTFLFKQGAKTFKFLDRTFNLNPSRAKDLFAFIIKDAPENTSFQFEIVGDILTEDLITYLNQYSYQNLFRFEIGIQSTNEETNYLIGRKQNKETLFKNIRLLQKENIVALHLDLIAGLPNEDLLSFQKSFDEVLSLRPLELQLGFLKLLKGTSLYNEARKYQYKWKQQAPYELLENNVLKAKDLKIIHLVEEVCSKYYNSNFMKKTMTYLLDNTSSPFTFFYEFGKYYETHYSWLAYNHHDLFIRLFNYLKQEKMFALDYLLFLMKQDYLNHYSIKPKIWWPRHEKKEYRKRLAYLLETKLQHFQAQDVFRYGIVEEYQEQGFLILYKPQNKQIYLWK